MKHDLVQFFPVFNKFLMNVYSHIFFVYVKHFLEFNNYICDFIIWEGGLNCIGTNILVHESFSC